LTAEREVVRPGTLVDIAVDRDVMVPMRDGVRLATDVYRPRVDGSMVLEPLPALLVRTPYDKAGMEKVTEMARRLARHGYVVVVQDCRGCFGSDGELDFLVAEADDGRDTVAWLRGQAWCDGRVGMWGVSYCGWTQTAAAAAGAEGLAALVPTMSGANAHSSSVRQGGAMELRFIAWAFWHAAYNSQTELKRGAGVEAALTVSGPPFSAWLERWPMRRGATQLARVPAYERWAFDLLTGGDYDERWRQPGFNPLAHVESFTDAPTLLIGGWYDSYARATLELYEALSAAKRGPVKVIMGPWVHSGYEQPDAGDLWFGHDARIDFTALHARWFDRWLRDDDNGVDAQAPVRIFVMGGGTGHRGPGGRLCHGGRWRDEQEWPLARTRFTPYHLHGDGVLDVELPAQAESSTTYAFDPQHSVPSIGGSVSSFADFVPLPRRGERSPIAVVPEWLREVLAPGGFDQRERPGVFGCSAPFLPLASRGDVLVFQSPPLAEAVEVTGPVVVHLWVSSSAVDTDVTAKLIDVYPPSEAYPEGYALNLTDGIQRLRYRDDPSRPVWLTPGEVVEATVTLFPISNLFAAGHRIRLDVSSSNFPRFDVNPNTGEPLGAERRTVVAQNTVFHDARRPSQLVLPVIPAMLPGAASGIPGRT
jgi:putative CocE/NonD family hydrolase